MYSTANNSNGNGYHHYQQPSGDMQLGTVHRNRARRGSRAGSTSRYRDGHGTAVVGSRVYEHDPLQKQPLQRPPCTDFDMAYFSSYAHVGIHEEMIKDHVRTETYRTAIMQHQSSIAGKVVLDVGCGTGILSIFCAQAGAKRDISAPRSSSYGEHKVLTVYAVDASQIALQAMEVVKANNLSDTIVVLHGRVEDVEINEQADVIISEWMGYMLLYESMLGSVIYARDRWLKPGGLILPSNATVTKFPKTKVQCPVVDLLSRTESVQFASLYIAPVTHSDRYSESIDFWRNVYGIDMSAILPLAKQCAFEEPCIETITGENVLTWPHMVKHLDCYAITIQELESVSTRFKFKSMMRAPLHGFAFWFDVEFSGPATSPANIHAQSSVDMLDGCQGKKRSNPNDALTLSTAPEDPPTHWQQTMIYFYDPIEVEQDQLIEGCVTLSQSRENSRFMNIHLEYTSGGRSFVKESVMR